MRIDDGFATLITFSLNPNVKFWEKSVTPPGISAGGPTDTTTMRNTAWRTMSPKKLKTLTAASASMAYDPDVYDTGQIDSLIGKNGLITVTFADGSSVAFWGWLDEFTPGESTEGEQPVAEITIQPSNQNNSKVEVAPVYTPPPDDSSGA